MNNSGLACQKCTGYITLKLEGRLELRALKDKRNNEVTIFGKGIEAAKTGASYWMKIVNVTNQEYKRLEDCMRMYLHGAGWDVASYGRQA